MMREHKPGFYEVYLADLAAFDVVDMAAEAIGRPLTPVASPLVGREVASAWLSPWASPENVWIDPDALDDIEDALDEIQFGPSTADDEYRE